MEAVKRRSQELVKETIFEADQNIALVETFMVAAGTVTVRATVHTHRLLHDHFIYPLFIEGCFTKSKPLFCLFPDRIHTLKLPSTSTV